MKNRSQDSFKVLSELKVGSKKYKFFSIKKAAQKLGVDLTKLPISLKILFENILRHEDGVEITQETIKSFVKWLDKNSSNDEISFHPTRVLMQDFTGVPAVVDLASMRNAVKDLGGDPKKINPIIPVDLVIDHSVQVDSYADKSSLQTNTEMEIQRNRERYEFLKWGQNSFDNFRVVPPGTGICHQVNLEYLAKVIWSDGEFAYPDSLVGTDSHTTMINGLSVLGWGVGGIEAEAAMLGQGLSMIIPEVIGFELKGRLPEGVTATDLVLTITEQLRRHGVVGKFVEFFGKGLQHLSLADRATIANMAPEYGATCGFFPIDGETLKYLKLTARDAENIELVEAYAKEQGLWNEVGSTRSYTDRLQLDLANVEAVMAGPKRPQDKIVLSMVPSSFPSDGGDQKIAKVQSECYKIKDGDVVIAAITSCTNTSNPDVMIAAGLLARNALRKGLTVPQHVKTSLAPGSQVVSEYLIKSGLQDDLDALGFNVVGYGCTTCIGNSGPLKPEIEEAIKENNIFVSSVLSGNRNFEGRVHPLTKANYLASPPLVVAYALLGTVIHDITSSPIGIGKDGSDIFLKDLWPSNKEIKDTVEKCVTAQMFKEKYADVFKGDAAWQEIDVSKSEVYDWNANSTYVKNPPYFANLTTYKVEDIKSASVLALFGDSITTDHISPAGNIANDSPAAKYLLKNGVADKDFNSYGSRRGNHEVMMRGTFANIRIKNEMVIGKEGGYAIYLPSGEEMSIYDAAMKYVQDNTPLVVVAGREYGTGSSRDWAAKGTVLLGVKALIAESFERIHRSNLVGMGVLPLMFTGYDSRLTLKLDGSEKFDILGLSDIAPKKQLECMITYKNGEQKTIDLLLRIDTEAELHNYQAGGILQSVVKNVIEN
jgi:aconitate hydratase